MFFSSFFFLTETDYTCRTANKQGTGRYRYSRFGLLTAQVICHCIVRREPLGEIFSSSGVAHKSSWQANPHTLATFATRVQTDELHMMSTHEMTLSTADDHSVLGHLPRPPFPSTGLSSQMRNLSESGCQTTLQGCKIPTAQPFRPARYSAVSAAVITARRWNPSITRKWFSKVLSGSKAAESCVIKSGNPVPRVQHNRGCLGEGLLELGGNTWQTCRLGKPTWLYIVQKQTHMQPCCCCLSPGSRVPA